VTGAIPGRPPQALDDPLFAPHFSGLRQGELLVQSCPHHGLQWPPREMCLVCGNAALTWSPVAKTGFVYTYTVSHRAFHPYFSDKLPWAVAVVELGCGVRMLGGWAGAIGDLACGVAAVAVPRAEDDGTFLYWTPSPGS
jgi:uncharacterized OB-fold protein